MFLLMLIKSQETVSIKAGHVYELNLPMLTQVVGENKFILLLVNILFPGGEISSILLRVFENILE